jgi:hypothetical protein
MQQSTDVVGVMGNAEAVANELGDALAGPQFGAESERPRTLEHRLHQRLTLLGRQLGRTARNGLGFQSRDPRLVVGEIPAAHRAPIDAEPRGDLMGLKPLAQ